MGSYERKLCQSRNEDKENINQRNRTYHASGKSKTMIGHEPKPTTFYNNSRKYLGDLCSIPDISTIKVVKKPKISSKPYKPEPAIKPIQKCMKRPRNVSQSSHLISKTVDQTCRKKCIEEKNPFDVAKHMLSTFCHKDRVVESSVTDKCHQKDNIDSGRQSIKILASENLAKTGGRLSLPPSESMDRKDSSFSNTYRSSLIPGEIQVTVTSLYTDEEEEECK